MKGVFISRYATWTRKVLSAEFDLTSKKNMLVDYIVANRI